MYFRPPWEEVFDWVSSSDFFSFNDPDIPIFLHRSSCNLSFLDISFVPSSPVLFCSWEVIPNLGYDHLPILLTGPRSPFSRFNERPPFFTIKKARWYDFTTIIDLHCPFAEIYSLLSLFYAVAPFTSLALNVAKSPLFRSRPKPTSNLLIFLKEAVRKRSKAFASSHRCDGKRQVFILAFRHASFVNAKSKSKTWAKRAHFSLQNRCILFFSQ